MASGMVQQAGSMFLPEKATKEWISDQDLDILEGFVFRSGRGELAEAILPPPRIRLRPLRDADPHWRGRYQYHPTHRSWQQNLK